MIVTDRLHLIPATIAHLEAELRGRDALATALGVVVPATWPPDLYDDDAVRYGLRQLREHPEHTPWGFHYIVRKPVDTEPATLIGAGGFKSAPDASGVVEIGYGIVSDQQRRGFAVEAVRGWIEFAFASPSVQVIIGQTLPHLAPSIGVMLKAGFVFAGDGVDPYAPEGERVVRYELKRSGTRD